MCVNAKLGCLLWIQSCHAPDLVISLSVRELHLIKNNISIVDIYHNLVLIIIHKEFFFFSPCGGILCCTVDYFVKLACLLLTQSFTNNKLNPYIYIFSIVHGLKMK